MQLHFTSNSYSKKRFLSLLALFTLFSLQANAQPVTYKLDNQHSYVQWQITHLGFSSQSGKWFADGTLILDKENPDNSKVNVTINMANMVTGNKELDKHLKGKDFFDVARYPNATFISNKIVTTSSKTANVDGTLTLHGVTKPVTLQVMLNKEGLHPMTNQQTAGFSGETMIKRSDFGIKTYLPALGDEVKLKIEVEANKEQAKT